MALIRCKGCGNMVSSRAESCPKCGFFVRLSMEQQEETNPQVTPAPASDTVEQQEEANQPVTQSLDEESGRSSKKGLIAVIAAVAIIVCGGIGWLAFNGNGAITVEITPELTEAVQKYDAVWNFSEGLAGVQKSGLWGFVNKNGEEVIPCRYDRVGNFSDGLAAVQKGSLCGFVNKNGEEVIPCRYDGIGNFSDGLAAVQKGSLCGFINKNGEEVIPCIYDRVGNFSDGLAAVQKGDLCGFVNKKGEEVIPCRYDGIGNFSDGLAAVQKGISAGYNAARGNTETEEESDTIQADPSYTPPQSIVKKVQVFTLDDF